MSTTAALSKPRIPAELKPEQLTAVIDQREQLPLDLSPLNAVSSTLTTGDYSVVGLESIIAVERKSLGDMLSCIGTSRERFDREVQRMLAFPVRCLVVESTWATIEAGGWRSQVTPQAAIGSLLGWIASVGCPSSWQATTCEPEGTSHGFCTSLPDGAGGRTGQWPRER